MQKNAPPELNDNQLTEHKKTKNTKIMNVLLIGFLAGIVIFGVVSAIISKNFVVLIPLLFPTYFIYRLINKSKKST
ncbi:hypothetical protein CXF67_04200 [Psychroflexus sp. MES1-P1E]|nr:hypothetical protein CXF67_04200 [Psychroflexus sp. MES1-P1E]